MNSWEDGETACLRPRANVMESRSLCALISALLRDPGGLETNFFLGVDFINSGFSHPLYPAQSPFTSNMTGPPPFPDRPVECPRPTRVLLSEIPCIFRVWSRRMDKTSRRMFTRPKYFGRRFSALLRCGNKAIEWSFAPAPRTDGCFPASLPVAPADLRYPHTASAGRGEPNRVCRIRTS